MKFFLYLCYEEFINQMGISRLEIERLIELLAFVHFI